MIMYVCMNKQEVKRMKHMYFSCPLFRFNINFRKVGNVSWLIDMEQNYSYTILHCEYGRNLYVEHT